MTYSGALSQVPEDTTLLLNEVLIKNTQPVSRKLPGGAVSLNSAALSTGIHTLGEADFVSHIKRLSGITISNDYSSGISVDGNDHSATVFTISGTPVFFPYRFGGIFSAFNGPHFSGVRFERGIHDASMPNRIGGSVDLRPNLNCEQGAEGEISIGMLASSLTARIAASPRFVMSLSARVSYIDQLYKWLLKGNDSQISYNFRDFNVSARYCPDSLNTFQFVAFHSGDKINYFDGHYALDSDIKWYNSMASLKWKHQGHISMSNRIDFTEFKNRLVLDMSQLKVDAPSRLRRLGLSGDFVVKGKKSLTQIDAGYELSQYLSVPLYAYVEGYGVSEPSVACRNSKATEVRVYGDAKIDMGHNLELKAGVSASYYHNGSYNTGAFDPRITLIWLHDRHTLSFHIGSYHQYLQQTGLSEIGLASDSWYLASRVINPVTSAGINSEYLFNTGFENIEISADAYWRHIQNQAEYDGSLLDLANNDYVAEEQLISSSGFNSGYSIGLQRNIGTLTGSLSYSYDMAMRHFPQHKGWLHARTDPGHSFKANLDYRISEKWNVGAQFSFASGRTYTPIKSIYVIAENLICIYGDRNSARLPSYQRLDFSGTYSFVMRMGKRALDSQINLSLINAYGHRNIEMQTFIINPDNGRYKLVKYSSLYRFLPSLSFTIKF